MGLVMNGSYISKSTYTKAQIDSLFYKLDGSNANGQLFLNATTYDKYEGGQVNRYVNGALQESWEYTPAVSGSPIGLLLSLTYA
jgi:hypothetical protein